MLSQPPVLNFHSIELSAESFLRHWPLSRAIPKLPSPLVLALSVAAPDPVCVWLNAIVPELCEREYTTKGIKVNVSPGAPLNCSRPVLLNPSRVLEESLIRVRASVVEVDVYWRDKTVSL